MILALFMATLTQTLTVGPNFFETAVFNVPQFDPALGELLSVTISGNVHDQTAYGVEFLCTAPGEIAGRSSTHVVNHSYSDLTFAGSVEFVGSGGEEKTLGAASLFDGVNDLGGTSGQTVNSSYDYAISVPLPITDGRLRYFAGTGTIPVLLTLHKTAFYGNSTGACGTTLNFSFVSVNQYTYTLDVTYTYQ